jgi:CubicO group peptidase (beta-lactamase class C family)
MKNFFRRLGMAIGIVIGVLALAGLVMYIMMPKTPKPPENITSVTELEDYFNKVAKAGRSPGLSVAVVKNGEMVYANGFGVADGPNNIQATKDSVYHWWSMTKIPTAIAVMQLHERGLLDIDDPIKEYLPFFIVSYDGVEQPEISIRQLLNHSSGLANGIPELITWLHMEGEPAVNQTELVIEKFPDYNELKFQPGGKSQYSNFGYMPLGALIETVSGQTYENYVLDNILRPLGMHSTNFVYTEIMTENEAIGSQHLVDMYTPFFPLYKLNYLIRERVGLRYWFHRVYTDQAPPTGLIGPVTDVSQFMFAYLNDGESILETETVILMNGVLGDLSKPGDSGQGLGWRAQLTEDGRSFLAHSGGGPGFATIFRLYPSEELGVVVMGNDSTINRELLADVLANMDW